MRGASRDVADRRAQHDVLSRGTGAANPTLRLRAGETVRLVLRNEDRGMKHDFTVPAWNAATPLIPVQREAEVADHGARARLSRDVSLHAARGDDEGDDNRGMTGLRGALASPESKAPYVRRLFHTIADRYDLITGLLSFGQDRRWKAALVRLRGVGPAARALDLACGTGDIAFGLAARGARVAGLDITQRMLQLARAKTPPAPAVAFRHRRHDGAAVSRRVVRSRHRPATASATCRGSSRAIAEIRRVLRPGGLLLSLDFNRPANPLVRAVYLGYLTLVGSALGWVLHRDPDTYRYIPESIRRYPGAAGVAALLDARGFADCRVVPLLGGLMAINVARRRRPRSGDVTIALMEVSDVRRRLRAAIEDARRRSPSGARAPTRRRARWERVLAGDRGAGVSDGGQGARRARDTASRCLPLDRRCGCRPSDPPRSSSSCRSTPSATIPRRSCSRRAAAGAA